MMSKRKYSRSSLAGALRSGGIGPGDTVLVHLDLAALGEAEGAPTAARNAVARDDSRHPDLENNGLYRS